MPAHKLSMRGLAQIFVGIQSDEGSFECRKGINLLLRQGDPPKLLPLLSLLESLAKLRAD